MQLNRAGPDIVVNARNAALPIVRPILPADESELQRFIRNLSPASRYRRFMMAIRELPEEMLSRFANPEPGREAALVACSPSASIIGLAQYVADETGTGCEVAVVVDDAWQRQGLGYALFDQLLCIATHRGITHAFADLLADNHAMRRLASKFGCRIRTNRLAPFLVQVTKTLAHGECGRKSDSAPCLGTPNPQRMSPVMRAARQQS